MAMTVTAPRGQVVVTDAAKTAYSTIDVGLANPGVTSLYDTRKDVPTDDPLVAFGDAVTEHPVAVLEVAAGAVATVFGGGAVGGKLIASGAGELGNSISTSINAQGPASPPVMDPTALAQSIATGWNALHPESPMPVPGSTTVPSAPPSGATVWQAFTKQQL